MRHVIIVETDALLAADFVGILEEAGHQVVGLAHTLEHALDLAASSFADLALIDIDGPGERESLDIARLLADRHFAPAIFLGRDITWEFMHDSRYYGPAGYMEKPYNAAAVLLLCQLAPINPLAPAREVTAALAPAQSAGRRGVMG